MDLRRWLDSVAIRARGHESRETRDRHPEAKRQRRAARNKAKRLRHTIRILRREKKATVGELRNQKKGLLEEKKALVGEMRALATELRRGRQALVETLSELPEAPDRFELIELLTERGALAPVDLHGYLTRIFFYRHIELMSSLLSSGVIVDKILHLYHRVRLDHYHGEVGVSLEELYQTYARIPEDSFLRSAFFNLIIEHAVRDSNVTSLMALLSEQTHASVRKIPLSSSMGLCRGLIQCGRHEECGAFLRRYLAGASPQRRLYFLEPARALFDPNEVDFVDLARPRAWRAILEEVDRSYDALDEDDHRTFSRLVTRQLGQIPEGSQDYMDVRFDPEGKARLFRHIAAAIEGKHPLSLVRVGDGEGYAYDPPQVPGIRPEEFTADRVAFEHYWWGAVLAPERRAAIGDQVRAAIAGATVLGVPSVYRIIRDFGNPRHRFGSTRAQRGLSSVLNALGDSIPIADQLFTEERAHHILFDRSSLKHLAERASRLVIVGCWPPDKLELPTTGETRYVLVSPHTRVANVSGHHEGALPLHTSYPEIVRQIEDLSSPGVLVLVAAGIIGKIFIHHAHRAGAVAIDIGSVADYLAGYKTRAVADRV